MFGGGGWEVGVRVVVEGGGWSLRGGRLGGGWFEMLGLGLGWCGGVKLMR